MSHAKLIKQNQIMQNKDPASNMFGVPISKPTTCTHTHKPTHPKYKISIQIAPRTGNYNNCIQKLETRDVLLNRFVAKPFICINDPLKSHVT